MKKNIFVVLLCLICLAANDPNEPTPARLPGAEPFVFKTVGDVHLLLHVVKPKGWSASDSRPCLVAFFGGGWVTGTPRHSIYYAKWAASLGMVGIAPDYRTSSRFHTPPEACVSDGRAAVRWIEDHAKQLGIDPEKIVCLGSSAGGHVAAWTAISAPVSAQTIADPVPEIQPAALILLWPVLDTTKTGFWRSSRFDYDPARAAALSVPRRMPKKMPPTLIFQGTADRVVPFSSNQAFVRKMKANGNDCELVAFPGAPHSPISSSLGPEAKTRLKLLLNDTKKFLADHRLLPASTIP